MEKNNKTIKMTSALALVIAAATPPLTLPLTPARAQGYAPMPPACQAASVAAQAEGAKYGQPPADANIIDQLQFILWGTGLLIESLDRSCRNWADYQRTRQQFQNTYDATMQNCLNIASNASDCRPEPYGG
jgi:hypothetical protein